MNRFFVNKENIANNVAKITGEDVGHITRVLRMRPGDALMVCDGACNEYLGTVSRLEPDAVYVSLGEAMRCEAEPSYAVTLLQGLPKAGKMETVIQKCVELGVSRIVPIAAARSVVQLSAQELSGKRLRYEKVAVEAAKQSRRGILPQIGGLCGFGGVDLSEYDLVLLAYEEEQDRSLKAVLQAYPGVPKSIALIIGPEGGLTPEEVADLCARGAQPVTLGKRILRTETAGMAVLAMLHYELGDRA